MHENHCRAQNVWRITWARIALKHRMCSESLKGTKCVEKHMREDHCRAHNVTRIKYVSTQRDYEFSHVSTSTFQASVVSARPQFQLDSVNSDAKSACLTWFISWVTLEVMYFYNAIKPTAFDIGLRSLWRWAVEPYNSGLQCFFFNRNIG